MQLSIGKNRLSSPIGTTTLMTSPSKMDSAMIEKERQALEKIKLKQ
jgi:hypothetical protein